MTMRRLATLTMALWAVLSLLAVLPAIGQASAPKRAAKAHNAFCVVPKVKGDTFTAARKRLAAAHCRVDVVQRPKRTGIPTTLTVAAQTPKAGKHVATGTKVRLTLKAKIQPTTQTPVVTTPTTQTVTVQAPNTPAPAAQVVLPATTTIPTTTSPATTAPTVRADIDPSYTQDSADPLNVTWAYDAGTDDGTLPLGVLSLTVYQHGHVSSAGGCTIDVGGAITGGNCTQALPSYGSYDVTVTYTSSSSSVAPATETDTEDIEPPAPAPITHTYTWGTDNPTQGAYIQTLLVGNTATVTVGDPNFEGADHVDLEDSTGAHCTAAVSGIVATCTMTDIATPTAYTLTYPGGPTQTTTQTISPYGVPQQQTVNSEWPADVVAIDHPTVTVQQVNLVECGGEAMSASWGDSGNFGCANENSPRAWPSSVTIAAHTSVFLDAWAYGTLQDDAVPTGTVNYDVSGGAEGTDYDVESTPCGVQCGYEQFYFVTPGTYTVSSSFTSSDSNYPDQPDGPSIDVTVVP